MESIGFLIKKSQFLSYLGQPFLKPTTDHPYSIAFTNNDIVLDFSPIYKQSNYSGKYTYIDEQHGIILEMNYQSSLLDGPCSITVWNIPYIVGTWKNGLPNGIFQETVMGLNVFHGNLVDGQRHGVCRIISDANQSIVINYCNGQESDVEKKNYNGIPVTVEKNRNVIISLTEITTRPFHYRLQFSGLTGQLKKLDVVYDNGDSSCKAQFNGDKMTVYKDKTNMIVYTGGYAYIPPFSLFLHGEGTLYSHGIKNYSGEFVYSRKQGDGRFYYKNGRIKYDGGWHNDLPHGHGCIYSATSDKSIFVTCEKGKFNYGFRSHSVEDYCPDSSFINLFFKHTNHTYEELNQHLFSSEAILPMLISRDVFTSPFIHTKKEDILRNNIEAASSYNRIVDHLRNRNIIDISQCTYLDVDFKMESVSYYLFPSLRKLVIHVLYNDNDFILQYQPHLEELLFVCKSEFKKNISILHCPSLSDITIDNNALINCSSFSIKDCNCLQEITIGATNDSICLSQLKSFELCYLPALSKLAIAKNSFTSLEVFHLHHLPLLQSLTVSHITFPNLKEFSLDNLPMFTSLSATHISSSIFHKIELLTLNKLPQFTFEGLIFNADCLNTLTSIHCDNNNVLKQILLYLGTDIQPLAIRSIPDEHTNWSCATSISINTSSQFHLENYLLPTICPIIQDITITSFDSNQFLQIESFQYLYSIKIGEKCLNHCKYLVVKNLPNLYKFSIGNSSFADCISVVFSNLPILSEITIQPNCFTKSKGYLSISGLPKLQSLSLNHSFECYNKLDIKSVINLRTILIEDNCFNGDMDILQLLSLQSLQNCTIRDKCFKNCNCVSISNNQHLSSISIMNDCFSNKNGTIIINENSELKSISLKDNVCCSYQWEIEKLPSLTSLEFANNVFVAIPSFSLSKFNNLRRITIGPDCFQKTYHFSLVNLKVLNYLSIEENCFMMKTQNSLFELQALPQLSILQIEGYHSCTGFTSIHIENINKDLNCPISPTCFKNITSYRGNKNDGIVASIINHSPWIENPCTISYNDSLSTKLQSSITELTISNNACQNETKCSFDNYSKLRSINIGSNCFKKCSGFTILSLPALRSVNIGKSSFTSMEVQQDVCIKNCSELVSFCMDAFSCPNASSLVISNLPSLSLLNLPSNSFNKASLLQISCCSSLFTLEIPAKSFQVVFKILIQNLPSLERIRMGVDSCQGKEGLTITIADCKELLSFEFDGTASTTSCKQCTTLKISNTPKLHYPDTLFLQKNIMQSLQMSNIKDTSSFSQVFTFRNLLLINTPSIRSPNDLALLRTNIRAVSIAENCLNNSSFDQLLIQDIPSLEAFEMKNNCCRFVKKFVITNCSSLHTVNIQSNCCNEYVGKLSIEACNSLRIISIGRSFNNYKDFFISKLDSLQALSISDCDEATGDEDYFVYQERMVINSNHNSIEVLIVDLPKLKYIVFGVNVMPDLNFLSLKNLPELSRLILGENALRMNQKKIFKREGSTIKYSNTILLENVPKLETINCLSVYRASFEFTGVVKVKNSALSTIERLSEDTLSNVSLFITDNSNSILYEKLRELSTLYVIKQQWKNK